jgi:hypothetical protein
MSGIAPGTAAPAEATVTPADAGAATAPADAADAGQSTEPADLASALAEITKWKSLSRKNEDQAKANADKAKQFDTLEESKKTELQKAQDELARIQAELATERSTSLKSQVAAAKGVPAELLTGSTQEELEAAADALLTFKGVPKAPVQDAAASTVTGKPVAPEGQITSREVLKSMSPTEVMAALAAGRLDVLQGKK